MPSDFGTRNSVEAPRAAQAAAFSRRIAGTSGYGLIELLITTAVMIVILSLVVQTIMQFQRVYNAQTRLVDAQYSARASLDIIARLVRNAQTITADPDGNGLFDSIRTAGDWNPPNGALTNPYETVTFTTAGGLLWKQEAADASPIAFSERVQSVAFTYFDTNDVAIADPVANANQIALVRVVIVTTTSPGEAAFTLTTAAAARMRE